MPTSSPPRQTPPIRETLYFIPKHVSTKKFARRSPPCVFFVDPVLGQIRIRSVPASCQVFTKSVLERIPARCCSASTMITVSKWSSLQHRTGRFFDRASIVLVPLDALISVSTNPLLQKQVTSHRGIDRRTPCSACRSTASTIATPSCVMRVWIEKAGTFLTSA